MPSSSKKQARTMAAASHDPEFAKKMGIPQDVAKEFNQADEKTGILKTKSKKEGLSLSGNSLVEMLLQLEEQSIAIKTKLLSLNEEEDSEKSGKEADKMKELLSTIEDKITQLVKIIAGEGEVIPISPIDELDLADSPIPSGEVIQISAEVPSKKGKLERETVEDIRKMREMYYGT